MSCFFPCRAALATGLLLCFSFPARAQSTHENLFTHVAGQSMEDGRPWMDSLSGDFWACMGKRVFDDTGARAGVESVFMGHEAPTEEFFEAAWYCGMFAIAAPWQSGAMVESMELGAPITYDTPGITALNQMSGRPPGIEQIADPSAVRLPDGRIALYFSGDHRAAHQSTRWVSKEPVMSISDPVEFEQELDYNLPTRLLWRQMFRLDDGSWRAFGNMDGIRSWESPDGLNWVEAPTAQMLLPTPTAVRDQLGLPQYAFQFNSFLNISHLDDGSWVGVMPHYRESMDSPEPDANGNGYDDPPFVLIYHSEDGYTWHYRSAIIGTAEGFVSQIEPEVYMFTMSDAVFFSRDLMVWTFGHSPHFHTYGIALPDGFILHFGTDSTIGIPLHAYRTSVDVQAFEQAQWNTMSWEGMPTIDELRGTTSGVHVVTPSAVQPVSVAVWPNPTTDRVTVSWESAQMGPSPTLQLVDGLGRILREQRVSVAGAGRQHSSMSLTGLAEGVYFVRVSGRGAVATRAVLRLR